MFALQQPSPLPLCVAKAKKKGLPFPLLTMLAVIVALLSPNPFLSLCGIASLHLLYRLFWTRSQPAIIFWALLHQWLQVNAPLIHAGVAGEDLAAILHYQARADDAYVLGLSGLMAFALGVWAVTRRLHPESLGGWLDKLDPRRCLLAYGSFIVIYAAFSAVPLPGTGQLLLALGFLKWGFFYIFFSAVLHTGRYRSALALCILLEFFFSLFSIFASFKAIMIMPLVLLPVFFSRRPRFGQLVAIGALATALIGVGLVWTAVKLDYRTFMAAGERGQVIRVSRDEAMGELTRLIAEINTDKLIGAVIDMTERVSYLDFLSGVMSNVPSGLPHEEGTVTLAALTHVVTPRVLFPEKEALHDSLFLNKYIGEYVADYTTTSMSVGYVGDLYIDFGWFAPLATFVLGLLLGRLYLFLYRLGGDPGWGLFLVMPMFFFLYLFEVSLIKLVGLTTTYAIVTLLVAKFGLPLIRRSVERRGRSSAPAPALLGPGEADPV